MNGLTTEFRMAKDDVLFLVGTSFMGLCGLVMLSVLVSWGVGGSEYKDIIYGDGALILAGAGFVVGAALYSLAKQVDGSR